ncbi:MAG TPA: M48 family metalloprotease [Pyrinomonadaceae bacterium]|jgi:Zn-dependent protease with chaperone function|nr:M48 family metalloprotease [Pyrinomonadaceae bacterium]
MKFTNQRHAQALIAWLMAVAIFVAPSAAFAQTQISYHSNRYSVADDVKVGRQAAAEAEQQLPVLRDEEATYYVEQVGRRLVNAIPAQFQHPEFQYYFKIINARDINAFALPGGPMYVNRGMIEAARSEGEMAGVMAHELAHVALRHGTAQATKAQKYQYGAIAGAILGSIIGGGLGQVVGQGSQMAVGAYFLKFSREYETEADILGAQIMARAGYDPRDLANMFRTIESQGSGRGGPEWMSSHPNPGRRYERINQEAALLRVNGNPVQDTAEFRRIQNRLRGMGRAQTMEEIARSGQRNPQGGGESPSYGGNIGRVQYPSSRYRTYTGGNLFRVSYPDNWRELPSNNAVWFAPEGGYGQNTFTHGVSIGLEQAQYNNLQQASDAFISGLVQNSRSLRQQSGYQRGSIDRHNALMMTLSNINESTGQREIVVVYTTLLRNGNLFYVITVAPQTDFRSFQNAFSRVVNSIQLND